MLEIYLIGTIGVLVVGLIGKEYKNEISDYILKKIEEE